MGKQEDNKGKSAYRWFIPLLVTISFAIWELTVFGFAQFEWVRSAMAFIALSVIYNGVLSWFRNYPSEKPTATMLIICIPMSIAFMLLFLPPFPYVRPWFAPIITFIIGFELWAFGIGYWIQETKLKKICTGRAIAEVTGNERERMDKRPGEVSTVTFYPILAYTVNGEQLEQRFEHGQPRPMEVTRRIEICYNPKKPEEFCFLNQKENKALTLGVPFMLIFGTCLLIATVILVVLKNI